LGAFVSEISPEQALVLVGAPFFVCIAPFLLKPLAVFSPASILRASFLVRLDEFLLLLAVFWGAAASAGMWCLKLLRPPGLTSLERALAALGLGVGCLSLGGLGLGLCGLAEPGLMFATLTGVALSGCVAAAEKLIAFDALVTKTSLRIAAGVSAAAGAPLLMLAFCGLLTLFLASGPQIFYDSLVYHFALPELYLRHGRIIPTPFNVYSGIPAGIEMLYLWLLPLDPSGSLCQMLHWSFGALTAGAIVAIGRRLGSTLGGVWAAAVFFSNPMVLIGARRAGVELGTSFYTALTLLNLLVPELGEGRVGPALTGIFAGLALGTNYQAVVILPAVGAYILYTRGRSGGRALLSAATAAVVVAAPWGLKNAFFYGNPVYPFLDHIFSREGIVVVGGLSASAHARDVAATFLTWPGFREFAGQIGSYVFNSEGDNRMSPAYLLLLPLLVFFRPRRPLRAVLLFAAAMWASLNLLSGLARFSIPALVPLSAGLALSFDEFPRLVALAARSALVLIFCWSGLTAFGVEGVAGYWHALESPQATAAYLASAHPSYPNPSYTAFQWANAHLPRDAKVLLLGEQRAFGLERDVYSVSLYVHAPIVLWTKAAASGDALYLKLRQEGITHLFVNKDEFMRLDYGLDLTPREEERFADFWRKHVEVLRDKSGPQGEARAFAFYRLSDAARSAASEDVPAFLIATDRYTPDP
jgi:hypothetical protein